MHFVTCFQKTEILSAAHLQEHGSVSCVRAPLGAMRPIIQGLEEGQANGENGSEGSVAKGREQVRRWRKEFQTRSPLRSGIRVRQVWHSPQGQNLRLCQNTQ